MIRERVKPLEMEAGNIMELVNNNKEDLDSEDLVDNIDKVAVEGNLSPNQIHSLSAKNGKSRRRVKI